MTDSGKRPVCCGVFEVTKEVINNMREMSGRTEGVYKHRREESGATIFNYARQRNTEEYRYGIAV